MNADAKSDGGDRGRNRVIGMKYHSTKSAYPEAFSIIKSREHVRSTSIEEALALQMKKMTKINTRILTMAVLALTYILVVTRKAIRKLATMATRIPITSTLLLMTAPIRALTMTKAIAKIHPLPKNRIALSL